MFYWYDYEYYQPHGYPNTYYQSWDIYKLYRYYNKYSDYDIDCNEYKYNDDYNVTYNDTDYDAHKYSYTFSASASRCTTRYTE